MDKIKVKIANFLIYLANKLIPYQKSYKEIFDETYDKVMMEHASKIDINNV